LLGLRWHAIAVTLEAFGLSPPELQHGWSLFADVVRTKLSSGDAKGSAIVNELDAWENLWFPVASASLKGRHPEVHAMVFKNLTQSSGISVIMGVRIFLERIDGLHRPVTEGGIGAQASEVLALLASRGLTAAKLGDAHALIERLGRIEPEVGGAEPTTAEQDAAEKAMWAWYLEWSEIARAVITSRRQLRMLGFLKTARGEVIEDPDATDTDTDPNAPVTPDGDDEDEDKDEPDLPSPFVSDPTD
jgi:hypothetical protein